MQTGKARTAHLRVCNFWAIYQALNSSDLRGKKLGICRLLHINLPNLSICHLAEAMGIPEID